MPLWTNTTIIGPAIAVLCVLHVISLKAMFGLILSNGYVQALLRLRDHGPYLLPGSQNPILMLFTGIKPLDKLLTLAGVMFANVTDGSAPQLSLYGFYFAGQLIGIYTAMVIEGLREGHKKTAFTWSALWGCLMQATGYGFTMPLYTIAHLLFSPTAKEISPRLGKALHASNLGLVEALPAALIIAYFIPSALMATPLPWNWLHQWLGGLWQGFPLWVVLVQYALVWCQRPSTFSSNKAYNLYVLSRAYYFAFVTSAICHWTTLGIIGARWAFPMGFSPRLRDSFTFTEVFLPPPFWAPGKMASMASAMHNLLQYDLYIGSIATLAWVAALNINANKRPLHVRHWFHASWKAVVRGIIAGPGGALVSLLWDRDERVIGSEESLQAGFQESAEILK